MKENRIVWESVLASASGIVSGLISDSELIKEASEKNLRMHTLTSLLHRLVRNLRGVQALAQLSVARGNSVFLKLPVGILLRNCLMDCIVALYIAQGDEAESRRMAALWNRDYLNAMFDEYEVYRDKLSEPFDDTYKESMYTMALEDAYLHELAVNDDSGELNPEKGLRMWKARERKEVCEGYKRGDGQLKDMKDAITSKEPAASLFAYYKYFSQYEHYSPRGDGDSLADFGCDNMHIEKVFGHIGKCIGVVMDAIQN